MNLRGHHVSQNTNENISRISALASKMGRIKKIMALYYILIIDSKFDMRLFTQPIYKNRRYGCFKNNFTALAVRFLTQIL